MLACGAANPRDIKAEGRDANGIYFAVDYLKSVTRSLLDSDFKDKKYIDPKDKMSLLSVVEIPATIVSAHQSVSAVNQSHSLR